MKAQQGSMAPPVYKPQISPHDVSRPSMRATGSVLQRSDKGGVYTTGETGKAQTAYEQAVAEIGPAIAHGFGNSMSGQSAKFMNKEKELQALKKEILEEQDLAQERLERNQRQDAKSEKVALQQERNRKKKAATLQQMALYVKANFAKFENDFDSGTQSYYKKLFDEFKAKTDKHFKADEEDIRYSLDEVIAQAMKDCRW